MSPSEETKRKVNKIRHERMDLIKYSKDNNEYFQVYQEVMLNIAQDYPELTKEVHRQINKKIRRMNKRTKDL